MASQDVTVHAHTVLVASKDLWFYTGVLCQGLNYSAVQKMHALLGILCTLQTRFTLNRICTFSDFKRNVFIYKYRQAVYHGLSYFLSF